MSEYQYHEWQTVDRLLTPEEQTAVNDLSSHMEVSSSQATVTYNWSDFRHDPKQVLLKYFDGYFYFSNWGSLRLMFRFPKGLLNEADIQPYCLDEYISFETIGNYQVLDLDFNPDDGGNYTETDEASLSHFIQLRTDLLEGDFRLLYLAWLNAITFYAGLEEEEGEYDPEDAGEDDSEDPDEAAADDSEDVNEPPVPAGLKKLSPALHNFVQTFGVDPFLIEAAAEASSDSVKPVMVNYRDLIARLPRAEFDSFLVRLAEGEPGVGLTLRKRLQELLPQERPQPAEPRTIQWLLQRAEFLREANKKRRAAAERQKHMTAMKSLAAREDQAWQQVDSILANGSKSASVYKEATALLEQLKQLAEFQDTRDQFQARIHALAQKYSSRSSLIKRWEQHGWI